MGKVQSLIIETVAQGGKVTFGSYNTGDLWNAQGESIRLVPWRTVDGLIEKGLLRLAPRESGTLATNALTLISAQ